jgi:hypothetical protein
MSLGSSRGETGYWLKKYNSYLWQRRNGSEGEVLGFCKKIVQIAIPPTLLNGGVGQVEIVTYATVAVCAGPSR